MEAVKLGRRRISDLDCDGYRLMKRRMNGTCHLEGNGTAASGGNWHMNLMSDKTLVNNNTNSASKQQQQSMGFNHQHHHANGVDPQAAVVMVQQQSNSNVAPQQAPPPPQAALMESASSSQQLLSSMSHPVLPPSLRESERMQSVERWINSIPLDAPIYVQTSLTQIVPITDPKSFPDDLSIADLPPSNNNAPSSNSTVNAAGDSSRGNYDYYSHNATATASNSGNHSHHQSHHLGPPQGGYARAYHQTAPSVENPNGGRRGGAAVAPDGGGGVGGPPNRFFNDYETQFVVKLFSDYFANGNCPSLNEVRLRMAHSQLQGRRNANSVRAKVKRLQANGRWRTYENM